MALAVSSSSSVVTYTYSPGDLFDTVTVNNIKFAIFHKPLTSSDDSRDLTITADCNCVLLAPLEAEGDIIIKAVNVLVLDSLSVKSGKISIEAENFYGIGTQIKGDVFSVVTKKNALTLGLYGRVEKLDVKAGANALVHIGMQSQIYEILTEIKALFNQGIQKTDGLQIAQALLKAAIALNDEHKIAIPALTFPDSQAHLESIDKVS